MIELDSKRLLKHFVDIPDPRKSNGQLYKLSDIILIALLAVISGAAARGSWDWLTGF
jgi:DDE_Tnp_1-associated